MADKWGPMPVEPVDRDLVVRLYRMDEARVRGLVVTGEALDRSLSGRARVLAAGPKCEQVKVGDLVYLMPQFHFKPLAVTPGDVLLVLAEQNVVAIDRGAAAATDPALFRSPDWEDVGLVTAAAGPRPD